MSEEFKSKPAVHGVTVKTIGGRLAALPELRLGPTVALEVEEYERASVALCSMLRRRFGQDRPLTTDELVAIAEGTQRVTLVTFMLGRSCGEPRRGKNEG